MNEAGSVHLPRSRMALFKARGPHGLRVASLDPAPA